MVVFASELCYHMPVQRKKVKNLRTLRIKVLLMSIAYVLHITQMYCDRNFGRMRVVFLQGTCRRTCLHMQFYMYI